MGRFFTNDRIVLGVVLLNAIIIFLIGQFGFSNQYFGLLSFLDLLFTTFFLLELLFKLKLNGFRAYWQSNWNKLDFILIVLSLPTLIEWFVDLRSFDVSFLLVFRVLRVFKTLRFVQFIPNIGHLVNGIRRALKASIFVGIAFMALIFIIGILSHYLFRGFEITAFKSPLISIYSIFKIFTVEGWYEIPESLGDGKNRWLQFLIHIYFIAVVLCGGIFGLSIVNSIFVDTMISDNNDGLENRVDHLDKKLDIIIQKLTDNEAGENS